jgi:hypothetical protein
LKKWPKFEGVSEINPKINKRRKKIGETSEPPPLNFHRFTENPPDTKKLSNTPPELPISLA